MAKRNLDICVVSDVHLGTYGSHAGEFLDYLNSIEPKILILNGDIFDAWQFRKNYFPKDHIDVLRKLLNLAKSKTKVYYIVGNHDEFLRKYIPVRLEHLYIDNKLVLDVNGQKIWVFHGDVFDLSVQCSKWLAKMGGKGYDYLIRFNRMINHVLSKFNQPKMSLSAKVKTGVKRAAKFINDFEEIAAEEAIKQKYDYVICGHIHQPQIRKMSTSKGSVVYMNSGDWVENLSALEFKENQWKLYRHESDYCPPAKNDSNQSGQKNSTSEKVPNEQDILESVLTENFSSYVF